MGQELTTGTHTRGQGGCPPQLAFLSLIALVTISGRGVRRLLKFFTMDAQKSKLAHFQVISLSIVYKHYLYCILISFIGDVIVNESQCT